MPTQMVLDEHPDRRRIRIGLAFLVFVVAASTVAVFVVEAPVGKALMLMIALFTVVRSFTMVRAIRRAR